MSSKFLDKLRGNLHLHLSSGYWENVYRTNTQSAYIAGKLEQYQNSGVAAYRLMVIEDGRTTAICRRLLSRASGYGAVIPADDKFWKASGFPPYHYQCRTSIRGVWPSQLKATKMDTARTAPDIRSFRPMAGFGGNPVDRESWWRMTDGMAVQAANHGVFTLIEEQARAMGLHNFALDLVSGSDHRRLEGTTYDAEKAGQAQPLQKEIKLARILEEAGHSVYFTPENTSASKLKNYDGIIDGKLAEMKIIESGKIDKITDRLEYCEKQKASLACIQTIAPQYTKQKAIEKIREFLVSEKINNVKEVLFVYDNKVTKIKK